MSRKIKINMICQVDRRGLSNHSLKSEIITNIILFSDFLTSLLLDSEAALAAEAVGHVVHHVPRVTLVTIKTQV